MCLIVFHWQPGKQLVVSANRDEFYQRDAAPLSQWSDYPNIYAGRDLSQGGTWLGVNQHHRFAALTNVRAFGVSPSNPPTRGELVQQFLNSGSSAQDFSQQLSQRAHHYAPFNLILSDTQQLWYISNYPTINFYEVTPGTHVLSNAQLDVMWPKAELACNQLNQWLTQPQDLDKLASLLNHQQIFMDEQLPNTGVGLEMERLLSAQFIRSENYGTRCSTGVMITPTQAKITEITWDKQGTETQRQKLII